MSRTQITALLATALLAGAASAELAIPTLTGRVVDRAGMLSAAEERQITADLTALESREKGAQMAVLTIPTLANDSLELFSMRVAEKWKLGRKDTDNGLLLLIVRDDRKIRIEAGYGLEDRLNDARCGDIIRAMQPYFRAHRYEQGIQFAVSEVGVMLTGQRLTAAPQRVPARSRRSKDRERYVGITFFLLFFIIPWLIRWRTGRGTTIFYGGYGGYRGSHRGGFSGGFSGGGGGFGGGGASGGW
jgi:uncharacterized protein